MISKTFFSFEKGSENSILLTHTLQGLKFSKIISQKRHFRISIWDAYLFLNCLFNWKFGLGAKYDSHKKLRKLSFISSNKIWMMLFCKKPRKKLILNYLGCMIWNFKPRKREGWNNSIRFQIIRLSEGQSQGIWLRRKSFRPNPLTLIFPND